MAIYLFSSHGTEYERADSDIDIALLFEHTRANQLKNITFSDCKSELDKLTGKDVDLINIRLVDNVFQFQIIFESKLLHCSNEFETDSFEMHTMSKYQRLNSEREGILEEIRNTSRVFNI